MLSLDDYALKGRAARFDAADVVPRLVVHDVADGKYVVSVVAEFRVGSEILRAEDCSSQDGVAIEISSGRGAIERDPYTGRFLIGVRGDDPVRARAVVDARLKGGTVVLAGEEKTVGIDLRFLPVEQQDVVVSGGSACKARWEVTAERDFEVQVRAGLAASVIPTTLTTREISWKHAMYFAHDERIGFMRLTYNSEYRSLLTMRSQRELSVESYNDFFPAKARNELYFKIDFVDMGYSAFNKVPMSQTIDGATWPPYANPVLAIDEPVKFYDVENPDRVVMTLLNQTMRLYDYSSIDVENVHLDVDDDGLLRSRWRIVNRSKELIVARWFVLGQCRPHLGAPTQANRLLGPVGSGAEMYEFDFYGVVDKMAVTQFIAMNVTSMGQPILSGVKKVTFRYPAE